MKPKITIKWQGDGITVIQGEIANRLMVRADEMGVSVETLVLAILKAEVTFHRIIGKGRKEVELANRRDKRSETLPEAGPDTAGD
jgi:hypothetical protein